MQPRLAFAERAREVRGSLTRGRVDRRVGGRIELAPVPSNARIDRRSGVERGDEARSEFGGSALPSRAETIDGARAPSWSRPSRDERAAEPAWAAPSRDQRDDSLLSPSGGLDVMPTTSTPSPEPTMGGYRGPVATPTRESDRVRGSLANPPTQPPRGSYERYRGPNAEPPRGSPERYRGPTSAPPSQPPRGSPEPYRGPIATPPRGAPERYNPPPSRTTPERYNPPSSRTPDRSPVFSPPTRSSPPMSSSPVRSSPMSSSPMRSSPMSSSPARSSPPSSTRNHRR